MKKHHIHKFFILIFLVMTIVPLHAKLLVKVDTPLKAVIFYFPSPAVMRCLNHSDIPQKLRKAKITRNIKFPDEKELMQNIEITPLDEQFIFKGDLVEGKKENPYFDRSKGIDPGFLFGLGELIGLQRKAYIKDKIGTQKLDYETFLKITKGKIGNKKYFLELSGKDKVIEGKSRYFLNGKGMLGEYEIKVEAKNTKIDQYEINEKYGPIEVFTTIEVYD